MEEHFDFYEIVNAGERQEELTGFLRSMTMDVEGLFREDLLRKKKGRLDIAIAGCSTGQEVYSYALVLAMQGYRDFQVDGYDLYEDRLDVGRKGLYGIYWEHQREWTEDPIHTRFVEVVREGHQEWIRFTPEVCDHVAFYKHDFSLAPFTRQYDVIVATNVLHQAQVGGTRNALCHLLRSLRNGGVLYQNHFGNGVGSFLERVTEEERMLVARANLDMMRRLRLGL